MEKNETIKRAGICKTENKIEKKMILVAALILIGAAIQNGYFDTMFLTAGMDTFSLLLTLILFLVFAWILLLQKGHSTINEIILMLYFVMFTLIGFVLSGISSNVLLMFRTSLYFFLTFIIFMNLRIRDNKIIWLYRVAGFCNAVVCLFFYIQNIGVYGIGFRDVTMNLYFSFSAIILSLFVELPNEKRWIKYVITFVCAVAIVTSQQRTQIIPLIILTILYLFSNVGFSYRKIGRLLLVLILIYVVYRIAFDIGVLQLVLNRFQNHAMTASNSTLWIRINTAIENLQNFNFISWMFGTGLSGSVELEMLLPNYLYKYGVFGTVLIQCFTLFPTILYGVRDKGKMKRMFFLWLLIMACGGFISGFGGQNGQLLLASIMGLVCNKKMLYSEKNEVIYTMPFMNIGFRIGGGE